MSDIYDSSTYQPGKSIGALVSRVRVEMLAALDRELAADKRLAPLEMSAAQYIIIANLAAPEEPKSAADLCKGISYDAGAMTRMLDRLEAKGLIRRSAQLARPAADEPGADRGGPRRLSAHARDRRWRWPIAFCTASARPKHASSRASSAACSRTRTDSRRA